MRELIPRLFRPWHESKPVVVIYVAVFALGVAISVAGGG